VQGILALRFGNGVFEPMWRRENVDHVQITAAETLGVEERGAFYEATGALRDMVPNHLFSLLTMVAMEPPGSFDAEAVRNEKAKLVEAIRPIPPENAVRGQYDGYRSEDRVAHDSRTETYAALKVEIDNWRWTGVPFYLRTGKRLARHLTTIAIHFRPAPQRLFPGTPDVTTDGNVLVLGITPDAGTTTYFSAKEPGPHMRLGPVCASFSYREHFDEPPRVGYETLLYHALRGNQLLFQREDMVDAGWSAVEPVLDAWKTATSGPQSYAPGSDGPAAADALLERDGRRWLAL
jgi:glucose-6-phosphate 1-dehydrogenase